MLGISNRKLKVAVASSGVLVLLAAYSAMPHRYGVAAESPTSVQAAQSHGWYVAASDYSACLVARGPAERMQLLLKRGIEATVVDGDRDSNGNLLSVLVINPIPDSDLEAHSWTYYTSSAACKAAIAEHESIPIKFN